MLGLFGENPPALATIGLFSFSDHFSLWLDATRFNYNGFGMIARIIFTLRQCLFFFLIFAFVDFTHLISV